MFSILYLCINIIGTSHFIFTCTSLVTITCVGQVIFTYNGLLVANACTFLVNYVVSLDRLGLV